MQTVNSYNSSTTKDARRMFARNFEVVEQFNSVIEICLRPTLVATVTKISDF